MKNPYVTKPKNCILTYLLFLTLQVRRRCEPVQNKFSLKWPDFLDCQHFPQKNGGVNGGEMCIPMPEKKDLKEYKNNQNDNYLNSLHFNDAFKNKLKEVTADDKLAENQVPTGKLFREDLLKQKIVILFAIFKAASA